jgi:hypothetical protein
MGKHDSSRDGQGKPDPSKWENAGSKDDGNKHDKHDKNDKK